MEAFLLILAIFSLLLTYSFIANNGSTVKAILITVALAILFFIASYSFFYTPGEVYATEQNRNEQTENRHYQRGFHGGFFYYGGRPYRRSVRRSTAFSRRATRTGLRSRGSAFRGRSFGGGGK